MTASWCGAGSTEQVQLGALINPLMGQQHLDYEQCVYDDHGNVIETHHIGDFQRAVTLCETKSRHAVKRDG